MSDQQTKEAAVTKAPQKARRKRQSADVTEYRLARRRSARGGPRVTLERLERDLAERIKRREQTQ